MELIVAFKKASKPLSRGKPKYSWSGGPGFDSCQDSIFSVSVTTKVAESRGQLLYALSKTSNKMSELE